ncbi:hypothetical protein Apa02nite_013490 [Actinoplanes palleronii]|uniref:Uncharacterized protein n=1 Tax=Actinoplanes palleronii TaxID=113570 RepID=A0ABQ4B3K8_9ACTN|nr:hypothetical protein Apa02nite_013490 [Actinoplanes palleronii]
MRAAGRRDPLGPVHLAQRHPQGSLVGRYGEIGLREVDELAQRIREERSIIGYAYNSPYHHTVSHILLSEHALPPSAGILGSAFVVGGPRGVALKGKTRDLHHR